jgi:hypothetical protein
MAVFARFARGSWAPTELETAAHRPGLAGRIVSSLLSEAGFGPVVLIGALFVSLGVLLVFLLARRLVPPAWAIVAAAIFAAAVAFGPQIALLEAKFVATILLLAGAELAVRFYNDRAPFNGLLAGALLGGVLAISPLVAIGSGLLALWLVARARPLVSIWPLLVGGIGPVTLALMLPA